MRYYVGLKFHTRELFKSELEPTEQSHGNLYNAVIGPFKTKRGAIFMRDHGQGNPHCRCVSEAEKLGKKYADTLSKN
jgi:hypothetical protein